MFLAAGHDPTCMQEGLKGYKKQELNKNLKINLDATSFFGLGFICPSKLGTKCATARKHYWTEGYKNNKYIIKN